MTELEVVQRWQAAVNARDARALIDCSDPKIEILGPRGSAFGHEVLSRWFERAGLSLRPLRNFRRDQTVVVAQHAMWHSPESNETMGEANIASVFRVETDKVVYYARFDSLEEALRHAGLTEFDET